MSPSDLRERDLDLLLREELYVSEEFQQFFFSNLGERVKAEPVPLTRSVDGETLQNAKLMCVRHSVQCGGESDLEVHLNCSGRRIRILIEDKIDAAFQTEQAERYISRGEYYVRKEEEKCDGFVTVLVAPNQYLAKAKHGFDLTIGLEEILEWFNDKPEPRRRYKASVIKSILDEGPDPGNPAVTRFWGEYYKLANGIAKPLKMRQPGPQSGGFLYFHPDGKPQFLSLVHRLNKGCVDLQFATLKPARDEFDARVDFAESDMYCVVTGGSVSLRVKVEELATREEFLPQRDAAKQGILAAEKLWKWFQDHQVKIKDIYMSLISQPG